MRVLRLDLEYDGAAFFGWAVQPGRRTVEGTLRQALDRLLGSPYRLRVAGRTDAGVHATGQVASVATPSELPSDRVLRALAGLLPPELVARAVSDAGPGFDARRDAIGRAYEYRVLCGPRSPLRRGRVLHHPRTLDLTALRAAAAHVVGEHDFRAFTPTQSEHRSSVRTVRRCEWVERDDETVLLIEADAFLRHMVRTLVGTMLPVGRGEWAPERLGALVGGAPREVAGPTAAPHALSLTGVRYPACPARYP